MTTNGDGYIYIPGWDRFQHYADRRPVWIKVYNELLEKDEYLALSAADRGVLHGIWLCISLSGDGRLSANPKSLARRLNVRRLSLDPLIQAGFIEVRASKAPAARYPKRSLEKEVLSTKEQEGGASTAGAQRRAAPPQTNGAVPGEWSWEDRQVAKRRSDIQAAAKQWRTLLASGVSHSDALVELEGVFPDEIVQAVTTTKGAA